MIAHEQRKEPPSPETCFRPEGHPTVDPKAPWSSPNVAMKHHPTQNTSSHGDLWMGFPTTKRTALSTPLWIHTSMEPTALPVAVQSE